VFLTLRFLPTHATQPDTLLRLVCQQPCLQFRDSVCGSSPNGKRSDVVLPLEHRHILPLDMKGNVSRIGVIRWARTGRARRTCDYAFFSRPLSSWFRGWLQRLGVKTLFIGPGCPWEDGYIESFNGKLRDELLNAEIFDKILEAKVVTEVWRKQYNTIRPHSSPGYRAPEAYTLRQVTNAWDIANENRDILFCPHWYSKTTLRGNCEKQVYKRGIVIMSHVLTHGM